MLTTSRASRRRLAAGSAAVSLLIAGGLGITASSSSAAEAIKERVGDALQSVPVTPPAAPAVPVTTPEVAAPVQLPPLPPHNVGKKRVVIVKDGTTTTFEGDDADKYIADNKLPVPPAPPAVAGRPSQTRVMTMRSVRTETKDGKSQSWVVDMPEIVNTTCPGDATKPVVENTMKDGKHRVVICSNRIEAMTRNAERIAANSAVIERQAMFSARASLAMARRSIENDRNLSDEQRAGALEGIAEAEAELRADANKD